MGTLKLLEYNAMFLNTIKLDRSLNLSKPEFISCQRSLDNYAVIEVGGSQKIVKEGQYYSCNRLQAGIGSTIRFGRVLAIKNNGKFHVGAPWITNALVEAEISDEFRGDKILVYKMNPKKHTRKLNGHRQLITR